MRNVDPIARVVSSGFCAGCGVCAAIGEPGKVAMELSKAGYMRPKVHSAITPAESATFSAICPGVQVRHEPSSPSTKHAIWGPLLSCATGYSTSAEMRRIGSSGGAISALCAYLLESGVVDFVAQNAADPDDPLGNRLQVSRSRADILRAAGSRYGPSAPLADLRTLLETGKRFAFVGKPCDVAALRALMRVDERIREQIPFLLSFMCAGVPSRHGTEEVLRAMGVDANDVVSFRYRGDGWPGKARAVCKDGTVAEMDYSTSWGEILNRHLQFRCKICPDGTGEFADVVCADAWYGESGYPSFEERDGRSLVLGRTRAGVNLIQDAVRNGALVIESLDTGEIAKMQPYQVMRKKVVLGRTLAAWMALGHAPKYRNLGLLRASLSAKPTMWLRNAIGTYKRAKGEVA